MAISERLAILVSANVDDAVRGLRRVETEADRSLGRAEARADRWAAGFTKAGAVMLTAGGLMAAGMWKAGNAASDLNETVSQTEQIFGDASGEIQEFANSAAGSLGQSRRAAHDAANTFGLLFTNMGKSEGEAAEMSLTMAALASDMASFKNTAPEDAVTALGAALRGESEPIRRYGVMLDDATLKQRALDMGLIQTTTGTLPPAIRAQAAYAEILEQTSTIQGDFARTAEDPANAMRVTRAEVENMTAALGEAMLPVMKDGIGLVNDAIGAFNNLPEPMQSAISKLAVATTGFLLVGGAMSTAVGQLLRMRESLVGLPGRLSNASRATRGLALAGGALAAVGVAAALYEWSQSLTGLKLDMEALAGATTDELVNAFLDIERAAKALGTNSEMEMFERLVSANVGAAEDLRDGLAATGHDVTELTRIIDEHNAAQDRAADRMDRTTDAAESEGVAVRNTAERVERLANAAEEAQRRHDDLVDSMNDVIDSAFGGRDALAKWEEGLDRLRDHSGEAGASLDLTTEAGRRNHEILRGLVEAGQGRLEQMVEERRSADEVRAAQALMALQLQAVADELGFTQEEAQLYLDTLLDLPTEVSTRVNIDTEEAQRRLKTITDGLAGTNMSLGNALHNLGNPTSTTRTSPSVPVMHDGGVFRAPPGRTEGLALLEDGERVLARGSSPVSLSIDVHPSPGMDEELIAETVARKIDWQLAVAGVTR